jgi:hypothetical protein
VIVATGQSPASIVVLSLTVVSASLVALGAYRTLAPLTMPDAAVAPPLIGGRTRAALEREKTLVLRSIKELEFDAAMGKISPRDFEQMAGRLRQRAIGLMRQLDEGGGYRSAIELELRQRMASRGLVMRTPPGADDLPARGGVAGARDDGEAPRVCSCGVANDADARFCKGCGARLPGDPS